MISMPVSVLKTMGRSARAFEQLVWPEIGPLIGGGEIVPVEAVTLPDFKNILDLYAGIDAWQLTVEPHELVRGLASRVQVGNDWNSFTIRYHLPSGRPTEFHKRLFAIKHAQANWLYPAITVQAYCETWTGPLITAAVIDTTELFDFVLCAIGYDNTRVLEPGKTYSGNGARIDVQENSEDSNLFIVVWWRDLTKLPSFQFVDKKPALLGHEDWQRVL